MEYSIYRLFGSKTRVTLLAWLTMNESKSFHVLQLSRRLSIPHSMLIKEIKTLEMLDIVKTEKIGKLKFVKINTALPYLGALKEIMIKTAGLKDLIYKKVSELGSIKYCLIFGSIANGKETSESDIDLLVIGKIKTLDLAKPLRALENELGREINYVVWNEEQLGKRANSKSAFLSDIISKQVIMVVGNEDEFRRDAERGAHHKGSA
ncbi:MAG: nucleotidyltransferase domain-containing protein [Rhabdochlamydiaceae bacterium]